MNTVTALLYAMRLDTNKAIGDRIFKSFLTHTTIHYDYHYPLIPFPNIHNNCYMNSVVQCLLRIIFSNDDICDIPSPIQTGCDPLLKTLHSIRSRKNVGVIDTREIISALCKVSYRL